MLHVRKAKPGGGGGWRVDQRRMWTMWGVGRCCRPIAAGTRQRRRIDAAAARHRRDGSGTTGRRLRSAARQGCIVIRFLGGAMLGSCGAAGRTTDVSHRQRFAQTRACRTAPHRGLRPVALTRFRPDDAQMAHRVTAYEFPDPAFVVGSDAVVCIARFSELQPVMSLVEIEEAFSGYASYRQMPWARRYVGVWGRKTCQRLRRFLCERGAEVALVRERPERLRLGIHVTRPSRVKVRCISRLDSERESDLPL